MFKPDVMLYVAALSVFFHYYLTIFVILVYGLYIHLNTKALKYAYAFRSAYIALAFFTVTLITAVCYKNIAGFFASLMFYFIIIMGFYFRTLIKRSAYENALNIFCFASVPVSLCAIIQKLINIRVSGYRCTLWFLNCNYLGSILAAVVIICAYKVITKQYKQIVYYLIALLCGIAMYLTGSMFVWIEIFMGVSVLLTLTRKHLLLGIFLTVCMVGCLFLYCVPEIFPRLSESNITTENRVEIWQFAIHCISLKPFFGRGFYSYWFIVDHINIPGFENPYYVQHAHNILIEPLLSCGIVGTVIIIVFLYFYFRKVYICDRILRKSSISTLILAVSAAVLIHSTTDMTMLWAQTALLYTLILSGVGVEEKEIEERRIRRNTISGGNINESKT